MTRRVAQGLAFVAVVSIALSGCSGIPANSPPQVIVNKIGGASQSNALTIAPPVNADPRTIVTDFLDAAATDDPHHTAARGFLTEEAHTRWSDTTVTVVDAFTIGNFGNGAVVLTGRKIGSISATGSYSPVLQGDGTGGDPPSLFSFGMKLVAGQWRIDTLQNGVIVTLDVFDRLYTQRQLYFYDLVEQHLVPDPRFTALVDPGLLATWLVGQLVTGPRPELQTAVTTELPAQLDPRGVTLTIGAPSLIEIPGSGQLDPLTRNLLAAQIALTLTQVPAIGGLSITDAGRPIVVPQAGAAQFSAADFQSAITPAVSFPSVYYIRNGGVVDDSGKALAGPVGNGTYGLQSVALASSGGRELRVAGVSAGNAGQRLLVGTLSSGLRPSTAHGQLSRPAWAPERSEVWVGDGLTVVRCGLDGKTAVVPMSFTSGAVSGDITALRFSPEGSRIAIVFTLADGTAQVWVGSVVRNQSQVRVDSLEPITPLGIAIKDVAWNDPLKLFVIGRSVSAGDTNIYEVQVDGSLWTSRNITNLPQDPDRITVAQNQVAWVSAGPTVWVQRAGSWASPGPGSTIGINPVYLE